MEKVGYYGSSFDPITLGHLWSANAVLQHCRLDEIVFAPAASTRIDKYMHCTDFQRAEMVRLAIQDNPKFSLSTYELYQAPRHLAEHTYYNLEHYKKMNPDTEVYYILGADILHTLPTWGSHPEKLIAENKFVVMERNQINMHHVIYNHPMLRKYNDNFKLIYKGLVNEISSSYIRDEFMFGQDPRYLMPDSVYNYIKEEKLYV